MNHLLVYAHPYPGSFCHAMKEKVIRVSKELGMPIHVRDLYQIGFNPVLSGEDLADVQSNTLSKSVTDEQKYLQWADLISFLYPVWWMGMPSLLKGYLDRVLTHGFAYGKEGTHLNGKQVLAIASMGTSQKEVEETGYLGAMKICLNEGTFRFCGIQQVENLFYHPYDLDAQGREQLLENVHTTLHQQMQVYQNLASNRAPKK